MKPLIPYNSDYRSEEIINLLKHKSTSLENDEDLDPLIERIGDAKYVLVGEASHGTHEYYTWRMRLTQRLIKEKNFSFVAVEGDWPDCYRINRYAKGYQNSDKDEYDVLRAFNRWPTWMWANWEMVAFVKWLKDFNKNLSSENRIGFYGLDVYSFRESMQQIMSYLEKNDPDALKTAQQVIRCFEPFGDNEGILYAKASTLVPELCEDEVLKMLTEIMKKLPNYNSDRENVFSTEQNAYIALNAEKYYRAMILGGPQSWNIRDRHMVSTLKRLMKYHGKKAKTIVWEHNTHIGDARATPMVTEGMVNVGQLVKEEYATDGVVTVGFGSYKGSVIAGRSWGAETRKMTVPEAKIKSWEHLFHEAANGENRLLIMNKVIGQACVSGHIDHRAIGVVYNPEYEKSGNYVPSILPMRYDAFIFLDESNALHPLNLSADRSQIPDSFPFGV